MHMHIDINIYARTHIYAHMKRGHSYIRDIILNVESSSYKRDKICFTICPTTTY